YFLIGKCSKGSSCQFLHEESGNNYSEEKICKYFLAGKKCVYGKSCWYKHEKREVSESNVKITQFVDLDIPKLSISKSASYSQAVKSNFDPRSFKDLCPSCYFEEKCPNSDKCPYIHGERCNVCNKNVLHPYNESRKINHIKACMKSSEDSQKFSKLAKQSHNIECSICYCEIFESSHAFGLLSECDHAFCLECILSWRSSGIDAVLENVKSCPVCKTKSYYIVPSKYFYPQPEEKQHYMKIYLDRMKQKQCRNFDNGYGHCDFGPKCLFRHQLADGTVVNSSYGIDADNFFDIGS
ncbi:MAG: hypothetical protein MHMPM18_003430, partial [Marteilia pararefringens]